MTKLKPGTMFADRYQILECLGRGGMGTVYSAQHSALAKKFAIKLLHRDLCINNNALTRFAQEARSASGIEHQNIIDVLDAGKIHGCAFYVMEYLKGEDLQTMFTRESPLPWERVQRIVLQICDAMQAAHDRRIIHRDLKPSNLYRITRGANPDFIKILDFGIAKVRTTNDETRNGLTAAGSILGTLKYMAPEQARGLKIDHRADIYSVGVIMYQALTGGLPFKGSHPAELISRLTSDSPTPMREYAEGIPEGVEQLVLRALSKDPTERFPSMHALASAIDRLKLSEPPIPRRVTHSRGPLIELDDSSIELISNSSAIDLSLDHTTLLHAQAHGRERREDTPAWRAASTRVPPARPIRPVDEVVTQTGNPRAPQRTNMRTLAPWLPGMALAGLMFYQVNADQPASLPITAPPGESIQTAVDSPNAPTPSSSPRPTVAPPTPESPSAPTVQDPTPTPPAKKRPPRSSKPSNEPEVDCHNIREDTLNAERKGDWAALYIRASSPCWADNERVLEWRVKAKTELKQFADCIALGERSANPRVMRLVKLCQTRQLMQITADE